MAKKRSAKKQATDLQPGEAVVNDRPTTGGLSDEDLANSTHIPEKILAAYGINTEDSFQEMLDKAVGQTPRPTDQPVSDVVDEEQEQAVGQQSRPTDRPAPRDRTILLLEDYGQGSWKQKQQIPNGVRECLGCHKDKPIEARGLCNACYRAARRASQRQYESGGPVTQAKGAAAYAKLLKLMDECKVNNQAKRALLRIFLPFAGLPPNVQEAHLEALDKTEEDYDDGNN